MRIDVYLASAGITASRTEAKNMIALGAVYVDGRQITRPSFEIDGLEDKITVDRTQKQYVSRGGIKLAGALSEFKVNPSGKNCIDVGASSGGFTDCLLQNGASSVFAVDSGYGQLAKPLCSDPRVSLIENYNARYMKPSDFPHLFELAVMDVSFISAKYIIEPLYACLSDGADLYAL
ncbi:MAG: TlyA family RNA methyltransferase [Clostridia bacterium]|nr:TlyA family RNA methyltransferase [Clostridia bacterium]